MSQKSYIWLLCGALLFSPVVWAKGTPSSKSSPRQSSAAPLAKSRVITLDKATEAALANSSQLKAAAAAMGVSEGEQRQAGALPNPAFGIEAENIAGQGPYRGTDSAEMTYGVSQLIEIGGKRSARQEAANQGYAIAKAEYEATRLNLIRDVKIAYAEAVAAKEGVVLAEKQKSLAEEILQNVTKRVNTAAEPLFQRSKSEVALATSEMALDKAQRDYSTARRKLAALWNSENADFDLDSSRFFEITPSKALTQADATKLNPDLRRLDAEEARRRALLDLEKANAIPDPTVSVGVRDFRESRQRAFVFGLSIPIPVFNLNRGNIAKAYSEVNKTLSDKQSAEIALSTELAHNQQELENAYHQAKTLKNTIIPAAQKAYELSRQGYQAGKFPYLEVLDAQRTLVEARAQYNDALRNYHNKRAEVERLTAKYQPSPDEKEDSHAD